MKNDTAGMTLIVKTITRLTIGLILFYGFYIVLQSPFGPGGGFAGGVIIALSFIHVMLAFGKDIALKKLNQARGLIVVCLAGVGLLYITSLIIYKDVVSLIGQGLGAMWLITLYDIFIALLVGSGLFLIFLVLVDLSSTIKSSAQKAA